MRFAMFFLLLMLGFYTWLNFGYYRSADEFGSEVVFFKKKFATAKIEFHNIHANSEDVRNIDLISMRDKSDIVEYCKYRLGIITQLETQEEVIRCAEL